MLDIPCVILSGGKSSRMGEDKTFLPFLNSQSLIDYQYNKLSKIFKKVYISSKENKFDKSYNLILDTNTIYSPMVALKSIMDSLNEKKVFIITVDSPLLQEDSIKRICKNINEYDIVIAQSPKRTHNLLGIFSYSCLENINDYISNDIHKMNHLIRNSNTKIIEFENENEFINMNTQEDYQQALSIS